MKQLTILNSVDLPTENQIEEFEKKIGFSLPTCYRDFLLTQNPKSVQESLYIEDEKEFRLEHFHPFSNEAKGTVQYTYSLFVPDVLPKDYLAFAYDAGGWQFIIGLGGCDFGKVFFCRMDEDFEDALTLLANDFGQFVAGLKDITQNIV